MENKAHALLAGVFVLLLGVATLVAIWWFASSHEVEHEYDLVTRGSVTGLNPQAAVRYRGMNAGKVDSVRIDPEDERNILVRIQVSDDIPINRATYATLAYQGVTGLAYVQLDERGQDRQPLAPSGGEVPRIPLEPGLMDRLTDTALDAAYRFQSIAEKLSAFFDDTNLERFQSALRSLQQGAGGIEETFAEAPETLRAVRAFFSEENLARINATLAHLESATGQTEPLMEELRVLATRADEVLETIGNVTASTGDSLLDGTMPRLNHLLSTLSETSMRIGRLLDDLEASPQLLLTGRGEARPGPGEAGFEPRGLPATHADVPR